MSHSGELLGVNSSTIRVRVRVRGYFLNIPTFLTLTLTLTLNLIGALLGYLLDMPIFQYDYEYDWTYDLEELNGRQIDKIFPGGVLAMRVWVRDRESLQ